MKWILHLSFLFPSYPLSLLPFLSLPPFPLPYCFGCIFCIRTSLFLSPKRSLDYTGGHFQAVFPQLPMKNGHAIILSSDLKSEYKSRSFSKQDMSLLHSIIQVQYILHRSGALGCEVLRAASTKDRSRGQRAALMATVSLPWHRAEQGWREWQFGLLWETLEVSLAEHLNSSKWYLLLLYTLLLTKLLSYGI